MPKRRTTTFSRGSRRLETRAHANRAFKKVTRQWALSLNIKCQQVAQDPGPDCPNGALILLMANAVLQGTPAIVAAGGVGYSDAVRIRRIEGNLYFRPENSLVAPSGFDDCNALVFDQAAHEVYMRMGLKKSQGPQSQAGVPDALNPLNNGATPAEVGDYQDGRWMKLWEHFWGASGSIINSSQVADFSCCSTQAGYTVPETVEGEQVAYNVPPIVCVPCGDPENPASSGGCAFTANTHRWWHCPIRYGRPIVLKESDQLGLYFGWERMMLNADVARRTQPKMLFFGGIRLLLES